MNEDYTDLSALRGLRGYHKLQLLWAAEGKEIMKSLNKHSKLAGKDTSLRYYAGLWAGFDMAIGALDRALQEIERQMGNDQETSTVDELLKRAEERKQP
jgi:hypothetical protein